MNRCCWENGAYRFARHRSATDFQFVKIISAKHRRTNCAWIGLTGFGTEDRIQAVEQETGPSPWWTGWQCQSPVSTGAFGCGLQAAHCHAPAHLASPSPTFVLSHCRHPGVLPPPAEGHSWVCRAEDGVLPEPAGGGQRCALLPAHRAEPGECQVPPGPVSHQAPSSSRMTEEAVL